MQTIAAAVAALIVGLAVGLLATSRAWRRSRVGFDAALRRMPEPVLVLDPLGRLAAWNEPALALLGPLAERPDRRVGFDELVQRGLRLEQIERARVAVAAGEHWTDEIAWQPPGGAVGRFVATLVPLPEGAVISLRDITRQIEQERKLRWEIDRQATALKGLERQLQERLADLAGLSAQYFQLFDTAPAFYLHLDDTQRIVVINSSGADSLGYEQKELVGRPVWEIFDADDRPRVRERLGLPEKLNPHETEEFKLLAQDGKTIPTLLSATMVPGPTERDKPGILLTLVDVSTIKEHQTLLRRISAELEERNAVLELKNEEIARADKLKSEFLNNVSHELRTPLHAMIGYAELIYSGGYGPTTDLQKHGAAGVLKRGEDLLALINNLLDLSRIEAGRLDLQIAAFDPVAAATRPIDTTRMLIRKKKGLKVRLVNDGAPALVTGDEDMYTRVLMNLLGNAARFTETGAIVVSLRKEGSGRFVTAVSDTGCGMAEDALSFIFEEFRQVDGSTTRKHGGSGLGLAICKKLCDLMGGEITVTSREGRGTTFYVNLPIHGEEVVARSTTRDWTRHETTVSR